MALVDMAIAMWPIWVGPTILGFDYPLDRRSNGILANAQRLYQFPLGVFGIAVATAFFPTLARQAADGPRFLATLRRGLTLSLLLGLPASVGLILVRHDAVSVLFGAWNHGQAPGPSPADDLAGYSADGLARAAAVLLGYAPAVWAYALNHVLARAFFAKGDTSTPMRVAITLVFVNLACNLTLIWYLREAGLAWASCITATIQCLTLSFLLRRATGEPVWNSTSRHIALRITLATGLMAAACLAVSASMPEPSRWHQALARLMTVGATGIVAFALAGLALGLKRAVLNAPVSRP
jgi:putative peptidoglycan lipid II flippase